MTDLPSSYSDMADEYARKFMDELDHKPLDRELLSRFAARVAGKGPVCDMGCGPGQIARYLRDCGVNDILGMDIAPGMIEQARKLNPDIVFRVGDMRAIEEQDNAWAGISAFYSIIHIPREEVADVLREWWRVLKPGGWVLLTIHLGDNVLHLDQWGETAVSLDYFFFQTQEMERYLKEAGFIIDEAIERDPYPEVEYQGRRAYIFARKEAQ
ncbi:MAG TPA: class I SAM-dependent methyltransferase [Aggregatilineaceae bacterium]|nr:class I SAM-dependent methyltransferase [Aggregatilineaceae bacterium]